MIVNSDLKSVNR